MFFGIRNLYGESWRASGGDQERVLAQKNQELAGRIRFDAPFVSA
jgi:hypothetical protein